MHRARDCNLHTEFECEINAWHFSLFKGRLRGIFCRDNITAAILSNPLYILPPQYQQELVVTEPYIPETTQWLTRAVIGLNFCPFAKAVHVKGQIRYVVSEATHIDALVEDLIDELEKLAAANPSEIDTTLLIHPHVMQDFLEYNDFLEVADAVVDEMKLTGIIQIASFHPDYQFAETDPDDITNFTNRAPYPTLHLLREESVEKAVAAFPEAADIFEKNIETLKKLGHEGWKKLL